MAKALKDFDPSNYDSLESIDRGETDPKYDFQPPKNGLVIRVHSKILAGYETPDNKRDAAFQKSIGQDNLWIQADEKKALIDAVRNNRPIPDVLAARIARFHLIDNTRGEPPRWSHDEIKSLEMTLHNGVVTGSVALETKDGKRGYDVSLYGHVDVTAEEVTRFDIAAVGEFWGEGRYTGWAPQGKFPLAVTFQLADVSKPSHQAVPHGAKGWLVGYYNAIGNQSVSPTSTRRE